MCGRTSLPVICTQVIRCASVEAKFESYKIVGFWLTIKFGTALRASCDLRLLTIKSCALYEAVLRLNRWNMPVRTRSHIVRRRSGALVRCAARKQPFAHVTDRLAVFSNTMA